MKLTSVGFIMILIMACFARAEEDHNLKPAELQPPTQDKTLVKVASGREFKGVTMPVEQTIDGKRLALNGMGLREVSIMGIDIKVYVAGLYLEKKSNDGMSIVNSPEVKQLKMQFLRHVSSSDESKSWREGLDKNCGSSCDEVKDQFKKLKDVLPTVSSGDIVNYTFDSKGVALDLNGKLLGTLNSQALAKAMLMTWVGPHPVTETLRGGLLDTAK
jgi:hypothetical protein